MPDVSKKTNMKVGLPEDRPLRSGELSRILGVSADTLRHYERKGLLKPRRAPNGYREYPRHAVERVRLIRSALAIGFKLDELERILKTRDAGGAPCRHVRELAAAKLDEIETLVRELTAVRDELRGLIKDWDRRLESVEAKDPGALARNSGRRRRRQHQCACAAQTATFKSRKEEGEIVMKHISRIFAVFTF